MKPFGVAHFPVVELGSAEDFERFEQQAEAIRSVRWLHEQSMATTEPQLVLEGTCGLCLTEARFVSHTRHGEQTPAGLVPNWREELRCDCEQRLINRERALLHYMLATGILLPWMRVLGLGELGGMTGLIRQLCHRLTLFAGARDLATLDCDPLHLVVSTEWLDSRSSSEENFRAIARSLVEGGRFVFTAPFDIRDRTSGATPPEETARPLGWAVLGRLQTAGFSTTKVCTYWSEEFGYLGSLNFIVVASK